MLADRYYGTYDEDKEEVQDFLEYYSWAYRFLDNIIEMTGNNFLYPRLYVWHDCECTCNPILCIVFHTTARFVLEFGKINSWQEIRLEEMLCRETGYNELPPDMKSVLHIEVDSDEFG